HRLHVPGREGVQLAAREPDRAAQKGREGAGRAHRGRADRGRGARLVEAHAAEHHHHGPPAANASSRIDPRILGMLLFIGSEIMLFGSFFTAYFFIRVVNHDAWPAKGDHLPVYVAGINTCILVTSSFTMHWALTSIKRGNRAGLKAGLVLTF